MILFLATIALIIVVIGLACYQTIMDNKIKNLESTVETLKQQIQCLVKDKE